MGSSLQNGAVHGSEITGKITAAAGSLSGEIFRIKGLFILFLAAKKFYIVKVVTNEYREAGATRVGKAEPNAKRVGTPSRSHRCPSGFAALLAIPLEEGGIFSGPESSP